MLITLLNTTAGDDSLVIGWAQFAGTFVVLGGLLVGLDRLLLRSRDLSLDDRLPRQLGLLVATAVALVILVIALPETSHITHDTKSTLLSLIGLAITAVLTLSSTTLAANGMAGLMLRTVGSFRPGDFVRVEDYFGRVSERGLFHTEIQTEDRDLVTIPNLVLATKPVRVVRKSGTIISAVVSIGYDEPHAKIERLLEEAARSAELDEPYVWITELSDHAVNYRVNGFLREIKTLISARSRLRGAVLDTLHGAGVEIVSPGFMYQRRTDEDQQVIAQRVYKAKKAVAPEELVFDKAEAVAEVERLKGTRAALLEQIKADEAELAGLTDEDAKAELLHKIERARAEVESLERQAEEAEEARKATDADEEV